MLLRCPHCGMDHPVRYRIGRAPTLCRCRSCRKTFAYFPALELEYAGTARRHAQKRPRTPSPKPGGVSDLGARLRTSPADRLDPLPEPERSRPLRKGRPGPAWLLLRRLAALTVGLTLILALFAQTLVHERAHLAVHPELQWLSDELCAYLQCPATSQRIPGAVVIRALEFRRVGDEAVRVDLRLENTLEKPHAWPLLEIAFSDRHGRVLGQGRWHPVEYLPQHPQPDSPAWQLAPGEMKNLRLNITAPARAVEGVAAWPL